MGYWKPEDLKRFQREYTDKILPLLEGKIWAKHCDLRGYITSMITEEIQDHLRWGCQNGFYKAGLSIDKSNYRSVVKKQMDICAKKLPLDFKAYISCEDADEWLRTQGF